MKCLVCKDRNVVYWGKWCCECVEVMSKRARERERVMHTHNFKATDIPGVCLCKCGAETYYVSESQSYYVSVEGE